jgi:DNA-binding CsgD family transcriptional regulator
VELLAGRPEAGQATSGRVYASASDQATGATNTSWVRAYCQPARCRDVVRGDRPVGPGPMRGLLALRQLAAGHRAEAERTYRALDPPASMPPFVLLTALAGTAELAEAFDDRPAAAEVYRLLAPFAELFVCGGAGVVACLGSAHQPLGRAAATLGRLDDAVRHLRLAVAANERAGMPACAALARYDLARRRRPGDREEAAALAGSTVATADRLGMAPLRRLGGELAEALAGRPAGGLTDREYEVAVLVSQGLTSRQIAAAAHISPRTAENHVQHILAKLGFSSRAQIAAWVATAARDE